MPEKFVDLEFMDKARMIKASMRKVGEIKDQCEEMRNLMQSVLDDWDALNECIRKMKQKCDS